jgi:hypothetical protein
MYLVVRRRSIGVDLQRIILFLSVNTNIYIYIYIYIYVRVRVCVWYALGSPKGKKKW